MLKEGGCRCADCGRTAVDSAARSADRHFASAAADDRRCDSDSAADLDGADDSRWDFVRADDFHRRSPWVATTVDAAEIADVKVATVDAADPGFARTQLQRTARNIAP